MKFKTEIFLLLAAIAFFIASTIIYSFSGPTLGFSYQSYAMTLVGCGSVLMVTASISYSKRSKKTV